MVFLKKRNRNRDRATVGALCFEKTKATRESLTCSKEEGIAMKMVISIIL